MDPVIQLHRVGKSYPGRSPSLRGTKLETHGPALWVRNARQAMRLTAAAAPTVRALSDCTLSVDAGEIFGILGPNGSGKTTLIKILAGLIRPTVGTGQVAAVPLGQTRSIRRQVSYVSTTGWMGLEWALTAEENLLFFARLTGMPTALAHHRTDDALRSLDLWEDREKLVAALSNGMRQRVIMARALLWRTPVVLLDEPLVGLDPHHRQALLRLIEGLARERGQTVLLADHDAQAVAALADRVLILAEGQVAGCGTVQELVNRWADGRIVELVTAGSGTVTTDPPAAVARVLSRPRPGPLGHTYWQITWDARQPGNLLDLIGWLEESGLTILELAERAPGLQDVLTIDGAVSGGTRGTAS